MAPQRIPGVSYAPAPSAESAAAALAWPPKLIVIHDTGNPSSTKEGEASYAHTRPVSRATSAHAYVDNGGVLGSLRLDRQAWAAYGYANRNGLHIEMCLRGDRAKTRQITAGLVRQLCQMTGIPAVKLSPADVAAGKRGICGHRDITIGLGVGDHTDPGADFPWTQFMQQVNTAAAQATPIEEPDLDAAQSKRLTNTDQALYALAMLDRTQDYVDEVPGATRELPLVDLLTGVRDEVHAMHEVIGSVFNPTDGGAGPDLAAMKAAFLAVLQSPEGQAAIVEATNKAEDS